MEVVGKRFFGSDFRSMNMLVLRFAARRASGGRIAEQFVCLASEARQKVEERQARRLIFAKLANSSFLTRCMVWAAARSVCDLA